MRLFIGLVVLVGCSHPSGKGAALSASTSDAADVCPWVFSGRGIQQSYWAHEIVHGCPTAPFLTMDPVCGPDGNCPHPCETSIAMADMEGSRRYTYDGAGDLVTINVGDTPDRCTYEGHRLIGCTWGDRKISIARDTAGRVISASDGELSWRYAYDARGDLVTIEAPAIRNQAATTWTLRHDAHHRLLDERSATGATVHYTYDSAGRMIRRVVDERPGTRRSETMTYQYASGRLAHKSSSRMFETTYTYDADGRIIEASSALSPGAGGDGTRYAYTCADVPNTEVRD